jgi:hypothetical protein
VCSFYLKYLPIPLTFSEKFYKIYIPPVIEINSGEMFTSAAVERGVKLNGKACMYTENVQSMEKNVAVVWICGRNGEHNRNSYTAALLKMCKYNCSFTSDLFLSLSVRPTSLQPGSCTIEKWFCHFSRELDLSLD